MVPPVQHQQPASGLGVTPKRGGLDDFDSGPPTALPLLGRVIPHQRRATPSAGSVRYGCDGERCSAGGQNLPVPDTTTAPSGVHLPSVSRESFAVGDFSVDGSEILSSGKKNLGSYDCAD